MGFLLDGQLDHCTAMSALVGGATYAASMKVSQLVSTYFTCEYAKMPSKDKTDWDMRLPSTVHALAMTAAAVYLFLCSDLFSESEESSDPVIYRTNLISDMALGFSAGYFLTDLTFMAQNAGLGGPEMAAHHVAALASVAAAAFRHHAHNYTLALLATECTTPFVNARWMLDKMGLRESRAYMVNGGSLLLAWLLGRIILFLFFFHHAYHHVHEIQELPWSSLALVVVVPILLFTLNLFWFAKILRGALKLFFGSPAQKARHVEEADAPILTSPNRSKDT